MGGSDLGNALGEAIAGMVILAALAGAAVMAILLLVVPWLWGLLKPLLHAWTA